MIEFLEGTESLSILVQYFTNEIQPFAIEEFKYFLQIIVNPDVTKQVTLSMFPVMYLITYLYFG